MLEYLHDPDATARAVDANGFLHTGDLGSMDAEGYLTLTGRIKLLIDVGGLKVNPLEVEAVRGQHPDVAACVVLPVRVQEATRDPQASDGKFAIARIDVTLSNSDLIVPHDDGLWHQVRNDLT